jgi:hypothetical protein
MSNVVVLRASGISDILGWVLGVSHWRLNWTSCSQLDDAITYIKDKGGLVVVPAVFPDGCDRPAILDATKAAVARLRRNGIQAFILLGVRADADGEDVRGLDVPVHGFYIGGDAAWEGAVFTRAVRDYMRTLKETQPERTVRGIR